jgi:glutathione S-transferase
MHLHAALITLLNVLLLSLAVGLVGQARGRFKIQAPATTGHPDFERVFRAHQNTLEQSVMFLPALWLATLYGNEQLAAGFGYVWLVGRAWYLYGYVGAARSRSGGFGLSMLAWLALVLLALWHVVARMLA